MRAAPPNRRRARDARGSFGIAASSDALGEIEIGGRLAEVRARCRFDAVKIAAHRHAVDVRCEDRRFARARWRCAARVTICASFPRSVLDDGDEKPRELHFDRRTAAADSPKMAKSRSGTQQRGEIDGSMAREARILGGNDGA